jgi:hypothetical protein
MKILSFSLILVGFFSFLSPAAAEVSVQDIRSALKTDIRHPYLYFTGEEKSALLDRVRNDPESRDIWQRLVAESNRLIYTPAGEQAPPQEKHTGFTNTDARLDYLRRNMRSAFTLAFVYQLTGDERYARKAFAFADAVCDLPTWVDRRHQFPIIYSRVWPWNVRDDQAAFAFDIESADTARSLAAVYDWLYPALDKRSRDRIRGALLEKAVLRVRGNYEYQWWADSYRCNWCAVCNAGLGTAALALLTEDPQLADVVAESCNRINRQLDEMGEDGGWQEGCGYYRKSIHALNFFADPLKRLTGGTFNLYSHPRLAANPITFLLYNTVTPRRLLVFEDSGANRAGTSHIWNKLAAETGSGETAWFRNRMFGPGSEEFDIIWPRAGMKPVLPAQPSKLFRNLGWVIMRSDFTDPEKVVLAARAGLNDDPHHGHLDSGHFVLYWRDQEYICDIGSPQYDELFFDETRWTYPQASSIGHNVILVNGELQIPAKRKDRPWKEGVGGKVLRFRQGENRDYTQMDLSGAYPGKELKGWRRHIILEKPSVTMVLDEVTAAPGAEIEARFHSECKVTLKDRYALLSGTKGMMALIPLTDGSFRFRRGRHADLPVISHVNFAWIPYFGVVSTSNSPSSLIASLIVPVETESEVDKIAGSLNLRKDIPGEYLLSFEKAGKKFEYRFRKGVDGLELE